MKRKRNTWLWLAFTLLLFGIGRLPTSGYAQEGTAGTTSLMNIGASARALGMGRAYVALADEPAAVYWNPAALDLIPRMSFALFHAPLYEGALYDFIGFVYPTLQFGTIGIGYARIGVGDIPVVDEFNSQLGSSSFFTSELYIAYGKTLPFNLSAGVTFKVDQEQFSYFNFVTRGLGLDLGFMYTSPFDNALLRNLRVGVSIQNIVPPELKLGTRQEQLPRQFRVGFLKLLPIGGNGKIRITLDFAKSQFEPTRFHLGTEYQFRDLGTIRLGFDQNNFSIGAGVKYRFLEVDYSFGNLSYQGDWPFLHRFALRFHIGKSREELIRIAEERRKQRERELVEKTKMAERQRFIETHLQLGEKLLREGKYFDAATEFQMVISEDPFHKQAKALLDSANSLIQQQLEKRQEQLIAQAVDKELAKENKRFVQLHFEKGNLYLQQKRFTEALVEFNLALERSPNDPIILQAIRTTKRRLNNEVRRLLAQARNEYNKGNTAEALRLLSEALVLSPDDRQLKQEVDALANRIKVQQYIQQALQLYDQGRYQEALALFEEALKFDPANEVLRRYVERTRLGIGKGTQELDPEAERQYFAATDLFLAGKYEEALKIWREIAKKYPYNQKVQDAIKKAEDLLRRTQQQE